jgi:hypothetical protein
MLRFLAIAAVALVLIAVAITALAPASLVAPYVERATHGRLAATGVEGTLWRGHGVLGAGDARMPIAWTLDAAPLVTGEMHLRITPIDGVGESPRADITAAQRRITARDVRVSVPARLLQGALTPRTPWRGVWTADGQVAATTPSLEWTPASYDGSLQVDWRHARLTVVDVLSVDLGDATAALTARGERLEGPVTNVGGDLEVRGDVAVDTRGAASISLLLTPRRPDDAELARALAAIGTPEGTGWRIGWQTRPR